MTACDAPIAAADCRKLPRVAAIVHHVSVQIKHRIRHKIHQSRFIRNPKMLVLILYRNLYSFLYRKRRRVW